MMIVIHSVLLILIGGGLLYLCMLSVLAFAGRRRMLPAARTQRAFGVVVPAHNEEFTIGRTLRSLRGVSYPGDKYDVIVIADNCTDHTAQVARSSGALVLERTDLSTKGKGYALQWAFARLLHGDTRYDAYVVCDADTTVSPSLLTVFNTYLDQGHVAIQCNDQVAPAPGAWSPEATRLGFLLYNYVRPAGRKVLGLPSGLRGNGMCFEASLLRFVPWRAHSRNEDLEYALTLLLHGVSVTFAPEATVLASMPVEAGNAESQRTRWEGGRFPIIRRFFRPLLREAIGRRSMVVFDALIDLMIPALVNLMGAAFLLASFSAAGWMMGVEGMRAVTILWGIAFACGFGHVIIGLAAAKSIGTFAQVFTAVPRYVVWKFRLYARLATKGITPEWIRTPREVTRDPQTGERP